MTVSEVDIAIVGAGAAGLAAAERLRGAPVSVLVLEAAARVGGRAHTITAGGLPLDLGAGWLHSADRNPLVGVAEARGFTIDRTPPPWGTQACSQGMSSPEQAAFHQSYAAWEKRVLATREERDRSAGELLDPGDRWNPLIDALSAWVNGAETGALSAHDYAAYASAATDANWRLREGYGALITALGEHARVMLDAEVTSIDHRGARIMLTTTRGEVSARAAIVTISSAMLAAEAIRFDPPLPDKTEASVGLPLGLANKLHLDVSEPELFPADSHLFGHIHRVETASYHLRPFGQPRIEAFVGGMLADALERDGPEAFAAFAIDELANLVGSSFRRKVAPIAVSAWRGERFVRGAYSHALPGHAGARAVLARPVNDRLFFAGEACSTRDFSTVHGAYATGTAAADAALAVVEA